MIVMAHRAAPATEAEPPDPAPPLVALRARYVFPGGPLEDVRRLRRDVHFQARGHRPNFARRVSDPLDVSATTLVLESSTQPVAAVRLHDFVPPAVRAKYGKLFDIERFGADWPLRGLATAGRFVVRTEHRRRAVFDRMMTEAYVFWRLRKVRVALLACTSGLHPDFERYGFREYLPPASLPGGTTVLRMALVMEDAPGLSAAGSPLQHLVRRPEPGAEMRAWMAYHFPQFN